MQADTRHSPTKTFRSVCARRKMSPLQVLFPIFLAFSLNSAMPMDLLNGSNDSELVGSNLNKVYAPAPFDDLEVAGTGEKSHGRSKGNHEDDDGGYYASKSAKKDNGYKHFDSFHKKGGDKYGYEAHSSFGKASGGNKGGSHKTSGSYHSGDGDGHDHESYYQKEGGLKNKKDHKGEATDGDFHYSNYESDGEGDSEHFSEEGDHFDDDGGHYSEGYTDDESSEGYYDGEGESEGYYDEGETKQKSVIHHGGPTGGATSYSVRHY